MPNKPNKPNKPKKIIFTPRRIGEVVDPPLVAEIAAPSAGQLIPVLRWAFIVYSHREQTRRQFLNPDLKYLRDAYQQSISLIQAWYPPFHMQNLKEPSPAHPPAFPHFHAYHAYLTNRLVTYKYHRWHAMNTRAISRLTHNPKDQWRIDRLEQGKRDAVTPPIELMLLPPVFHPFRELSILECAHDIPEPRRTALISENFRRIAFD